jgi:glycosyltransferase involved in cell wall biosynthesis
MKILHLGTGKSGGARLAANRLADLQKNYGFEVALLPDRGDEHFTSLSSRIADLSGKFMTAAQGAITKPPYGLISTFSISKVNRYSFTLKDFDVLHIHNWFNLLSLDNFDDFSREIPIVFTLHDERLLTGGCHYTFDCTNNVDGCAECPAVKFGRRFIKENNKKLSESFKSMRCYGVISPSYWLMNKARESKLLEYSKVARVIPNVTNLNFKVGSNILKQSGRLEKSILFVAADLNQKIKGFNHLINALSKVNLCNPGFTLHIVGKGTSLPEIDFPHVYHGYLDEIELKSLMAQTQICILPSVLDNLPSVAIEAIAAGNVLIVNDVGGLTELVEDGKTGFKCTLDPEKMSEVISRVLQMNGADLDAIRMESLRTIEYNYSDHSIFYQHEQVYRSICEQWN